MQKIALLLLMISSIFSYSQNKETKKILNEGKLLFRLEKGSWYGTDDILERFKSKKDSIGGYLSYETETNHIHTIFFSRFDSDKILVRYEFDSLPTPNPIRIDTVKHKATTLEQNLIAIRQDAREKASSNEDDFFKFYENASLNFIPLINENERNVFVLTGPQVSGIVLIGNDYKLKYNNKNKLVKKEKIHNSILEFPYNSGDKENKTVSTYHSHVITDYISSTDICTLLLYKDYVEWNQHIVISQKEVSIFDLDKESLFTMKRKAWEKIYHQQKEKK
ncbi:MULTISPECIES: hypothetical protein [Mesonia]|uniref:Uncharacterized protein n=1 Tax=Mesonia oceanica TaxID=2687242 RepID=A0AC61Y7I5_9FLAO|nr:MULTISPECIES: hypothetical protein [Mesonia]MAN26782.1 hypothetical protein [Mesonia sp.]MAQ40485.1 hypothetical protein [Mesonia sp.]MBJ98107.1 hypothetical protein [Flavobacteriaceae bacterium]VVV00324.1 hypothetical protein FVB9532_01593 [Mesonia oceanica]|tara:strand:+ start:1741 stop:2574 length:834 start_codon:yes stop_codon:yes gene_type:complete